MATSLRSHHHDQIIHCGENAALDTARVLRDSRINGLLGRNFAGCVLNPTVCGKSGRPSGRCDAQGGDVFEFRRRQALFESAARVRPDGPFASRSDGNRQFDQALSSRIQRACFGDRLAKFIVSFPNDRLGLRKFFND